MNMNTITFDSLRDRIMTYGSVELFAELVKLNAEELRQQLDGKEEFTLEDIVKIRTELNLNDKETQLYFFPDYQPEETSKSTKLINALDLRSIVKRLENIEDGINALDMLTTGQGMAIGDTITNEDFLDAFSYIMKNVKENVMDLRADLTGKYMHKCCQI